MKVDQNQPPSRGSTNKPSDAQPVQGTDAPGAKETRLRSPFFNLLVKGRRGEEDSLPGSETKELIGKNEPEGELIFQAEHPIPQPIPHDETQKGGAGVSAFPTDQKIQHPLVESKVVPRYAPESKTQPPQNAKIPVSQLPVTIDRQPDVQPEEPPKTISLPIPRNILKADPKRRETPAVREVKTGTPGPTSTATPAPALRSDPIQPVVSQVHSGGSTASVERIKALAGEIVDKLETTRGPKGESKVDIQFNSRTLQGLQVSISKHDTGVSIRFNTASEQVSQLLTQNVETLVQTLAAKGVDVVDVRIVPNTPAGSGSSSKQDSRQGSRGGGGGGDGGRSGQRGGR